MTFSKFLPVAIMVGIFAAVWIYVGSWLGVALWVPFISWAMYFVYDPAANKAQRIPKEILGITGGILFGYLTILAMPFANNLVGSSFGLPLVVFFVATIIVLLELTDWFELAPAYFFAYAGYFAYVFGGMGTPAGSLIPFWILIMVGLAIGFATAHLRRMILSGEGVYGSAQKTVFDRENQM